MKKTCREISFGVPQTKAFADMGQKIGVPSYQKLSVLLVQSITRGSTDLFFRLKEEEEEAFFQRKEQAKRKDAGRKRPHGRRVRRCEGS